MFVVVVVVKPLVSAGVVVKELTALNVGGGAGVGVGVWVGVDILADAGIIAVAVVAITLECAVLSDMLIDVLAGALTGKIIDVVTCVGGAMLADVKANVLVSTTTVLEFAMPASLYKVSCCTVSDCWLATLSNFDRALQAWMPSYHV